MTSDEYRSLLQQLATEAAMADPSGLVDHGRVKIGEHSAWLEHEPAYDSKLVQLRMLLGGLGPAHTGPAPQALLEANYVNGYGGDCVFSLLPETDDVVVTIKLRLQQGMTAREFWQDLSDAAHHGAKLWDEAVAKAGPPRGALPSDFHPRFSQQV
jgi:hypothetical protein